MGEKQGPSEYEQQAFEGNGMPEPPIFAGIEDERDRAAAGGVNSAARRTTETPTEKESVYRDLGGGTSSREALRHEIHRVLNDTKAPPVTPFKLQEPPIRPKLSKSPDLSVLPSDHVANTTKEAAELIRRLQSEKLGTEHE
jgi:hypothetical protein